MKKDLWVYDLETFKNFFSYCGLNVKTQEIRQYICWKGMDHLNDLVEHLYEECSGLIGFNNIGFDYPILHKVLLKAKSNDPVFKYENIAAYCYNLAQEIIGSQNSDNNLDKYKYQINDRDMIIPQLDLFKIYHFDNKAKRASLKDVEIAINYPRVQDLPYHHTHEVKEDEIDQILDYNLNDVKATFELYKRSKDKINMRIGLTREYGINVMNFNDPKIGSEIFAKFICEDADSHIDSRELKKMRTFRSSIDLAECILPSIKFKSKEFNGLLNKLKL